MGREPAWLTWAALIFVRQPGSSWTLPRLRSNTHQSVEASERVTEQTCVFWQLWRESVCVQVRRLKKWLSIPTRRLKFLILIKLVSRAFDEISAQTFILFCTSAAPIWRSYNLHAKTFVFFSFFFGYIVFIDIPSWKGAWLLEVFCNLWKMYRSLKTFTVN